MQCSSWLTDVAIILSIVTCGIYGLYWFVVLSDDVKDYSNDQEMMSGGVALLLTIVTCGIFGIYWAYKLGKNMFTAQQINNLPATDNSIVYLLLEFFGLGIVAWAIIQSDLNAITRAKNGVSPQAQ